MANLCCSSGSCPKVAAHDAICMSGTIIDGVTIIDLWTNETLFKMNGTIVIENLGEEGSWPIEILINGQSTSAVTYEVEIGGSYAMTIEDLLTISMKGKTDAGAVGENMVKISFSLNYMY